MDGPGWHGSGPRAEGLVIPFLGGRFGGQVISGILLLGPGGKAGRKGLLSIPKQLLFGGASLMWDARSGETAGMKEVGTQLHARRRVVSGLGVVGL